MRGRTKFSFLALLRDHETLDAIFEDHQRALLARDIGRANQALTGFRKLLGEHIRFEEQSVLPLFVAKHAESPGATLQLFQAEHAKITATADKLAKEAIQLTVSSDVDASLIALLDEEAQFKGLLSHHTLRERNGLFPKLDGCTTERERKAILSGRIHDSGDPRGPGRRL